VIKAWSQRRPDKSFAGFTLEGFKKVVAPSIELRQQIADSYAHTQDLLARRDDADMLTRKALRRVIHSVMADIDEGEDGELYMEMGYMSRAARTVLQSVRRVKNAEKAEARTPEREVVE
jgi:uncharacterized membrane-anchored protein